MIPRELRAIPHWCLADPIRKLPLHPEGAEGRLVATDVTSPPYSSVGVIPVPDGRDDLPAVEGKNIYLPYEWAVAWSKKVTDQTGFIYPIGFVLTENDPFVCIDLDIKDSGSTDREGKPHLPAAYTTPDQLRRYEAIVGAFRSYTEISKTGKGAHIWLTGPYGPGHRRDGVEVYSKERFMICTGLAVTELVWKDQYVTDPSYVYDPTNPVPASDVPTIYTVDPAHEIGELPILEGGDILANLLSQMKKVEDDSPIPNADEKETDDQVWQGLAGAENGQQFVKLWNSTDPCGYPSNSEADMSLMQFLAFRSPNNAQCVRMFLTSARGARDKVRKRKSYLLDTLRYIRRIQNKGETLEELEDRFSSLKVHLDKAQDDFFEDRQRRQSEGLHQREDGLKQLQQHQEHTDRSSFKALINQCLQEMKNLPPMDPPPNLLGELTYFILGASPRPVLEVSLSGAIGYMAAICGKAFNVSDIGLNVYMILVARSAIGKEMLHKGTTLINNNIHFEKPGITGFFHKGRFSSMQAMVKVLNEKPSITHFQGEIGEDLANTVNFGSEHRKAMAAYQLEIYSKSGYADEAGSYLYKDDEKSVNINGSVSYSLVGETTPNIFHSSLEAGLMANGWMSRFTVVTYHGDRPEPNYNINHVLDPVVKEHLIRVVDQVERLLAQRQVQYITLDNGAQRTLGRLEGEFDNRIRGVDEEAWRQMWNRAAIKIMKLAALYAIGDSVKVPDTEYLTPVITSEAILWAKNVVYHDIRTMIKHFAEGIVTVDDSDQQRQQVILDVMRKFLEGEYDSMSYGGSQYAGYREALIVPRAIINQILGRRTVFIDHNGRSLINETLKQMSIEGTIVQHMGAEVQAMTNGKRRGISYSL